MADFSSCASAAGRQSFLVVFDFDHTVVDCNTDEVVLQQLGRGEYQRSLMRAKEPMQWTQLIDDVIAPFTRLQIEEAVAKSVTMDDAMPEVFRYLLQQQQQQQQARGNKDAEEYSSFSPHVDIAIASDANLVFIESAIAVLIPFARHAISQIHSNSFHDVTDGGEARRCRLAWYESGGHDCRCCNARNRPNMCKSRIIARLLHTTRLIDPTVIFIGDGANDYCPVLNMLRPRDWMFARRGFPIHQILADKNGEGGGCCRINLWANAKELLQCFQCAMSPAERLPTLVRFRDVGPLEFRVATLLKRIPQVLSRTLADNGAHTSAAGKQLVRALIEATRGNAAVSPLPGGQPLSAWLQSYAQVQEFDTDAQEWMKQRYCSSAVAPRWGQLPWLHGEIYFYHLVVQYLLLAEVEEKNEGGGDSMDTAAIWEPNIVTPYAICSPIATQDCVIAPRAVVTGEGSMHLQSFNASFLASGDEDAAHVSRGVALQGGWKSYHEVAGGNFRVPANGFFQSYRDIFSREKHEVLHSFLRLRIYPMLACVPWEADEEFIGVLLRWMLWGNGVDLSMFTLTQLQEEHGVSGTETHNDAAGGDGAVNKDKETSHSDAVVTLRLEELKRAMQQDDCIVGNQLDEVVQLVRRVVGAEELTGATPRTVNIVMDNVGVECVADLAFALWVLHHHPSLCVTLHVKSMPYYVSDVTPPDISILIQELESCAQQEPAMAAALMPFVRLVREALNNGRLRIDADAVWTQPCEYRELPPRVCNAFFYTKRLLMEEELQQQQQYSSSCMCYTPRSALVIFKGDLNFRRLVGDRHWDRRAFLSTLPPADRVAPAAAVSALLADTPRHHEQHENAPSFQRIVSSFWPVHVVPVCVIRTVKSEGCVGVTTEKQEALECVDPAWKTSGKYGVVLLAADGEVHH